LMGTFMHLDRFSPFKRCPAAAVQRLQRLLRVSRQTGRDFQMEKRETRDQLLLQFIQDERVTLGQWLEAVRRRRQLGHRRLAALQCFEDLIFEDPNGPLASPAHPWASAGPRQKPG
jgi:hypothetical protein